MNWYIQAISSDGLKDLSSNQLVHFIAVRLAEASVPNTPFPLHLEKDKVVRAMTELFSRGESEWNGGRPITDEIKSLFDLDFNSDQERREAMKTRPFKKWDKFQLDVLKSAYTKACDELAEIIKDYRRLFLSRKQTL